MSDPQSYYYSYQRTYNFRIQRNFSIIFSIQLLYLEDEETETQRVFFPPDHEAYRLVYAEVTNSPQNS